MKQKQAENDSIEKRERKGKEKKRILDPVLSEEMDLWKLSHICTRYVLVGTVPAYGETECMHVCMYVCMYVCQEVALRGVP